MSRNRPKTSRTESLPAPANIRVARNRGLERTSFAQWKTQHRFAARAALTQLATHRIGSIVNVFVIGLALALPLLLDFAVRNLASVGGALGEQREIAVFLSPDLDRAGVDQAMRAIRAVAGVDVVTRRTPEQGLEELRQLPGFDGAVAALEHNPLPWVALVTPKPQSEPSSVVPAIEQVAGVDLVQYDAAWRARLESILQLLRRIVLVLATLLGLGATLLIANAIRLDVMARREEISIVSLLGGSDAYVRRPFLYSGACYGFFGALAAVGLLWIGYLLVRDQVAALAATYAADFRLAPPDLRACGLAVAIGLVLGWIGALVAATLQLISDRAD
jgi:cell division transport system permease protein